MTPEKLYLLADISRGKDPLSRLVERIGRNPLASVHFVLERLYERASREYVSNLGCFANLRSNPSRASIVEVTPPVAARDGQAIYEDIATAWVTTSNMMGDTLSAKGIPYVHVLQPNQYFTRRRFSDAEARAALNADSLFKSHVEQGYPALLAASTKLKPATHFLNAVGLFDDEAQPAYMDDCCHYTLTGNRRLGSAVADAIVRAVRSP